VKSIGTPRALKGFAITCPVGNPNLSIEDERTLRKRYLEKALNMLKHHANIGNVENA